MKIQGLNIEDYATKIQQEIIPVLWGHPEGGGYKPKLCSKHLGDGLQFIWMSNIDQRPYYWIIRVDSKTDIKHEDFCWQEVEELVSDELGLYSFDDEDYNEETDKYPMVNTDNVPYFGLMANFKTGDFEFQNFTKTPK
jgi:hypothetical protein